MKPQFIVATKKIIKGREFVMIPREEYEDMLSLRNVMPRAKLTLAQKKDLEQARKAYRRGEYMTLKELEHELGISHSKPSA